MSARNVCIEDEEMVRTLRSSLERELSELRSLHEAQADDLKEAFSPGVINLLRQLSEDDAFFQFPTPEESSTESFASTDDSPDYWKATKMTFKFLCDEFMPAPKDQQMGRLKAFLDQVRGSASRIRLPGGASLSPDQNVTLRQCVTAVKTMKEVLGSKFASLQKYVKMQIQQGSQRFSGEHHSTDAQRPVQGFATGTIQNNVPLMDPASSVRHESIFRYSGPSNPEVSRVIKENPTCIRGSGDAPGPARTGVIVTNVIRTIQETPESPTVQQASEEVNQGLSRQSPSKRYPLRRQSHVDEED